MRCPAAPSKRRFSSVNRALEAVAVAVEREGGISVYQCPACKGYHLTKAPRSGRYPGESFGVGLPPAAERSR